MVWPPVLTAELGAPACARRGWQPCRGERAGGVPPVPQDRHGAGGPGQSGPVSAQPPPAPPADFLRALHRLTRAAGRGRPDLAGGGHRAVPPPHPRPRPPRPPPPPPPPTPHPP